MPRMAKTIIVTGASRGIGLTVARFLLLSSAPANIVALARSHEPLQKLKEEFGGQVEILPADLGDLETPRKAVALAMSAFGRLDGLVLNHGCLDPVQKVIDADIDAWKKGWDINYWSLITFLQAAIPQLRLSRGKVIFTSSGAAVKPTMGWGFYGGTKAALNHLNMSVAREEPDITFVSIRPGNVATEMQADLRSKHTEVLGEDATRFVALHKDGTLLRTEQPGNVIARLVMGATSDLSGQFFSWNDTDLAAFQDE